MKFLSRSWLIGMAFGLMCSAVLAQANWPARPIKLVVPYGPGSSPDVIARIISEKLATRLGQPVIIDNRVGAGGNTGTGAVAKAAGDGYTFVISTNGPLVYNTVLYKDRKSTRLNCSHITISYAVFCLKKPIKKITTSKYV